VLLVLPSTTIDIGRLGAVNAAGVGTIGAVVQGAIEIASSGLGGARDQAAGRARAPQRSTMLQPMILTRTAH
jgi:hypothetical protein